MSYVFAHVHIHTCVFTHLSFSLIHHIHWVSIAYQLFPLFFFPDVDPSVSQHFSFSLFHFFLCLLLIRMHRARRRICSLISKMEQREEWGEEGGGRGRKRDSGNISKFDLAEKIADIWYLTYLILLMRSDKIESMCVNRYVCLRVCVRYWYRDKSIVSCGFN